MAANDESGDGNDVHVNHDYARNAGISGEYTANENGPSAAGTAVEDDSKQKIDSFVDQDDLDLQNAIGDVFGQFDFGQLGEEVKDEINGPVQQAQGEHEHEQEHDGEQLHDKGQAEQLQLEDGHIQDSQIQEYAAGGHHELQDRASGGAEERVNVEQVQEQGPEAHEKHSDEHPLLEVPAAGEDGEGNSIDDDFDLSAAIGDAFAMVSGEQDSEEGKEEAKEQVQTNDVSDLHNHSNQSDGELDLEAVIGNAFESLTGNGEQSNAEEGNTNKEQNETTEPAAVQENDSHAAPSKEPSSHHIAAPVPVVVNSSGSFLHEDLDLESAIGNAFKEISEKSHEDPSVHELGQENNHRGDDNHDLGHLHFNEHSHENSHEHDEDLDLENAIGDAFKSISEQQPEENHSQADQVTSQPERPRPIQSDLGLPLSDNGKTEEEKDLDIESAISEAFKSAIKPYDPSAGRLTSHEQPQSLTQQHPDPQSQSLAGDLSFVVQNLVSQMSNNVEVNPTSNASQSNSIPEDILQELALEITNQVQDHGNNQNKNKQPQLLTDMPQIDDNVLAHFQNEAYKDEQGKDDTANTSGKIDSNSLQAALATVVRNAIESNATTLGDNNARQRSILSVDPTRRRESIRSNANDGTIGGGADLDQLRMNDILQNAFNMAMENPQDLLLNLDMDEDSIANASSTGVAASNSAVVAALAKLSHPIPSSTTTFLESLNRSQDIELGGGNKRTDRIAAVAKNLMNAISENGTGSASGERKKSLSIAETLALHRSSMTGGPRRDYSSIESIEEVLRSEQQRTGSTSATAGYPNNPYMSLVNNSQLSNALSSLSSHINSGSTGGETNLLNVIRQMTNSLSSNKLQGYTFLGSTIGSGANTSANVPTAEEIVASYKDKSESLLVMTQSLQLAKNFLESSQSIESDNQAIDVIDNVLGLFNTKTSTNQFEPIVTGIEAVDLADLKPDAISSIRDSVISSVSNFTNSKHWRMSSLLGEKPKSDTPEYKERIRMENRERKKRWREENAERNKDNDLRSRVLKRASAMFGDLDSFEKKAWVDDEFNKRREKRIAKQKKEDQERRTKNEYFGDSGVENGSSNGSTGVSGSGSGDGSKPEDDNPLIHDLILVKNVTDTFNILSGSTSKVEPSAALAATSVATATIAALYAKTHGILDLQQVSSAVSSILSSLMDNTGQKERLLSLSRGISSNFKSTRTSSNSFEKSSGISSPSTTTSGSGFLNKISSTIRNFTSTSPNASDGLNILDLENMKISSTKRKSIDYLGSDPKRLALSDSRKSVFEQASQLLNAHPMKMPQYKKPTTLQEQKSENSSGQSSLLNLSAQSVLSALTNSTTSINTDVYEKTTPTLTAPTVSPFISNKVASAASSVKPPTLGLRKPGSFQRPAFSKPEPKKAGSGMGFPSLYSASFKLK